MLGRIPVGANIGAGVVVLAVSPRPVSMPSVLALTFGTFPLREDIVVVPILGSAALVPFALWAGTSAFAKTSGLRGWTFIAEDKGQPPSNFHHDGMDEAEGTMLCIFT